jgi:hypothetical protein
MWVHLFVISLILSTSASLEEREADRRILVWRSTPGERALQGAAVIDEDLIGWTPLRGGDSGTPGIAEEGRQ